MEVRRLRADEWERYRAWRLAMLHEAPYAFGTTFAQASAFPDDEWRERVTRMATSDETVMYVAEHDGAWHACAGCYVEDGVPNVFGVWTHPDHRGRGAASRCVEAAVTWAREQGYDEIRLMATDTNTTAIRLYERLGFTPNGVTEPLPSDPSLMESEYALRLR
jgi:ribosomal protein S18 acetylase RimI-like enzyme